MRRRWYYVKRMLREDCRFAAEISGRAFQWLQHVGRRIMMAALCVLIFYGGRDSFSEIVQSCYETYAVQIADDLVRGFLPAWKEEESADLLFYNRRNRDSGTENEAEKKAGIEAENEAVREKHAAGKDPGETGSEETDMENQETDGSQNTGSENQETETAETLQSGQSAESQDQTAATAGLLTNGTGLADVGLILEKLNDYDYLMKKFYNVHPTTTADRSMMQAESFLAKDFSLEKKADTPQILIYHTHSQETYADYPQNPDADVVHVGTYLAELLREKGYGVIHDESVYDDRNGKLDRSAAYTYALDGITGILQKYPSIEVVLDIHRDGVSDGTRLVTEISGKQTAKIMFFNGTSMSPDGPIEYLPNPNLEGNLAFSFQMQLFAAAKYPGFTRKIYLKGLRYNEHVRERAALIEVGAQTNTYAEAREAMEPLSEILDQVLTADTGG